MIGKIEATQLLDAAKNLACGRPLSLILAASEIENDARVLKTEESLNDAGYKLVIIGLAHDHYSSLHIDGFPTALVPSLLYKQRNYPGPEGWIEWGEEIGNLVSRLAGDITWEVVYTHCMFGFQAGYKLVEQIRQNGNPVVWAHDIYEDMYGYDNILNPGKIESAKEIESDFVRSPDLLITINELRQRIGPIARRFVKN